MLADLNFVKPIDQGEATRKVRQSNNKKRSTKKITRPSSGNKAKNNKQPESDNSVGLSTYA